MLRFRRKAASADAAKGVGRLAAPSQLPAVDLNAVPVTVIKRSLIHVSGSPKGVEVERIKVCGGVY